jgi:hypothetical protein
VSTNCAGQTTGPTSASATETIATAGGSLCIPAFGGFSGTLTYPTASSTSKIVLTSSTTNIGNYPSPGTVGTPVFYLAFTLSHAVSFAVTQPAGDGLFSASFTSGQSVPIEVFFEAGSGDSTITDCRITATAAPGGGLLAGLGDVFEGVGLPSTGTTVIEVVPGNTNVGATPC